MQRSCKRQNICFSSCSQFEHMLLYCYRLNYTPFGKIWEVDTSQCHFIFAKAWVRLQDVCCYCLWCGTYVVKMLTTYMNGYQPARKPRATPANNSKMTAHQRRLVQYSMGQPSLVHQKLAKIFVTDLMSVVSTMAPEFATSGNPQQDTLKKSQENCPKN